MLKIVAVFLAILGAACLAFMWGCICGYENINNAMNWSIGWDDGYEAGQEAERIRQCREELRKNLGTDGDE